VFRESFCDEELPLVMVHDVPELYPQEVTRGILSRAAEDSPQLHVEFLQNTCQYAPSIYYEGFETVPYCHIFPKSSFILPLYIAPCGLYQ
jgi:hypothetical protein